MSLNRVLPSNVSPTSWMLNKVEKMIQPEKHWFKREVCSRVSSAVLSIPMGAASSVYHGVSPLVKLPVVVFNYTIGFIPVKGKRIGDRLPEGFLLKDMALHVYKAVAHIIIEPFIGVPLSLIYPYANIKFHEFMGLKNPQNLKGVQKKGPGKKDEKKADKKEDPSKSKTDSKSEAPPPPPPPSPGTSGAATGTGKIEPKKGSKAGKGKPKAGPALLKELKNAKLKKVTKNDPSGTKKDKAHQALEDQFDKKMGPTLSELQNQLGKTTGYYFSDDETSDDEWDFGKDDENNDQPGQGIKTPLAIPSIDAYVPPVEEPKVGNKLANIMKNLHGQGLDAQIANNNQRKAVIGVQGTYKVN